MILDTEFESCRERAVIYLGLDYSKPSGRVRKKLLGEGYSPDKVEAVIDYLKDIDYINDERAAGRIVKRYTAKRMRSRKAMQYVLIDAGIDRDVVVSYIETLPSDEESSLALLEAHFSSKELDNNEALKLMARRGYSSYTAGQALKIFSSSERNN